MPTIYAQVKGDVPETFDVFLGSVSTVGLCVDHSQRTKLCQRGTGRPCRQAEGDLKGHLERFCADLNLEIVSFGGGWIPMGGPVKQMVDGTTLAVGDAAGLVMPSNGGGISQAIISGCFAAESILDHLENGTPLTSYEDKVRASMGPALKNSLRSKNMGYAFMRGDVLTELILRILGPIGGIKRAMECERPLWLI